MCSVIEANLTIICANLPTLGYNLFFDWVRSNRYGGVYAEGLRRLTIGNGPDPVDVERGDIAEHHSRQEDRDTVNVRGDVELDDSAEQHRRHEDGDLYFSILELPSRGPVQLPD